MNLYPPVPISFLGIGLMGRFLSKSDPRTSRAADDRAELLPHGLIKNQIKDLNGALEVASRLGVTLPLTQQVRQLFVDLADSGQEMLDHSALILRLEALSAKR
jgi:3-hydroxyisobutyrate dehydrogenase-like beta-hydroxyacid dehydrogenase